MTTTIADLELESELTRMTTGLRPSQGLTPGQSLELAEVKTAAAAIALLTLGVARLLAEEPAAGEDPLHPAVGALATLRAHPAFDPQPLTLLRADIRQLVEELAGENPIKEWDPAQLEWQLVLYLKMAGGETPLDPRRPLPQIAWPTKALKEAWATLLDLAVLRAWGVL